MRIVSIALLIFLSCVIFYAQDKKEPTEQKSVVIDLNDLNFDDGCGSPLVESQTYGIWKGKVVKILSSNKIVLDNNFTVLLLGIDNKVNQSQIKAFLVKNVLNKEVFIQANLQKESNKKFGGVVQLLVDEEETDYLNEYLLENGLAKFKDFDSANLVPYYFPCRLQKAEKRAKEAKLGIWTK